MLTKIMRIVGIVAFVCFAAIGVFIFVLVPRAQEQSQPQEREVSQTAPPIPTTVSSKPTETDDLVDRCEESALDNGYTDGQCAFTFIDACVKTRSKTEMERIYNLQRTYGTISGNDCPTNPTTYTASFAAKYAARDKF